MVGVLPGDEVGEERIVASIGDSGADMHAARGKRPAHLRASVNWKMQGVYGLVVAETMVILLLVTLVDRVAATPEGVEVT